VLRCQQQRIHATAGDFSPRKVEAFHQVIKGCPMQGNAKVTILVSFLSEGNAWVMITGES